MQQGGNRAGRSVAAAQNERERDLWIAFAAWAMREDAWHVATRYADILGPDGAAAAVCALARAEARATGREALVINEARLMLATAIERRWS